jgi:hypothetical protein
MKSLTIALGADSQFGYYPIIMGWGNGQDWREL